MDAIKFGEFRKHHIFSDQFAQAFSEHDDGYCLYVVRDNNTVFYVGQVSNWQVDKNGLRRIHQRIMNHWFDGDDPYKQERIGRLLVACSPESDSWMIEMLTIADAEHVTGKSFWKSSALITDLENVLIEYHRPCLNIVANPRPQKLPPKFKVRYEAQNRKLEQSLRVM
jgi:hypothetical protein